MSEMAWGVGHVLLDPVHTNRLLTTDPFSNVAIDKFQSGAKAPRPSADAREVILDWCWSPCVYSHSFLF